MTLIQQINELNAQGIKLIYKQESFFMKFLNIFIWLFNKEFMTKYTTTIGKTIYVPEDWDRFTAEVKKMILKHEKVHCDQFEKYGFLKFSLLYLFYPFPIFWAKYRVKFEIEAYIHNIEYFVEKGIFVKEEAIHYVVKQLRESNYFWAGTAYSELKLYKQIEKEMAK